MRAGPMRHRVTLQQPVVALDSYGEPVATWTTVDEVWAKVAPLAGREFVQVQGTQAEVTTRVVMRYRSDLEPKWRLVYTSHTYDVQAVINVGELNRELEVMCREVL